MNQALLQPMISTDLGELYVSDNTWNCTLTQEASTPISEIQWNGETLTVTFRKTSKSYEYGTTGTAVDDLLVVVKAVLSGVADAITDSSTPTSVGVFFNQLVKTNQLTSI